MLTNHLSYLCLIMLVATTSSQATHYAGISYISKYIFRGQQVSPNGLLLPSCSYKSDQGFSYKFQGYINTEDQGPTSKPGQFSEVDFQVSYQIPVFNNGNLSELGFIEYTFPGSRTSDRELYIQYSFESPLKIAFTGHYGINGVSTNRYYLETLLSYSILKIGKTQATASHILGHHGEVSSSDSGFQLGTILSIDWKGIFFSTNHNLVLSMKDSTYGNNSSNNTSIAIGYRKNLL